MHFHSNVTFKFKSRAKTEEKSTQYRRKYGMEQ